MSSQSWMVSRVSFDSIYVNRRKIELKKPMVWNVEKKKKGYVGTLEDDYIDETRKIHTTVFTERPDNIFETIMDEMVFMYKSYFLEFDNQLAPDAIEFKKALGRYFRRPH